MNMENGRPLCEIKSSSGFVLNYRSSRYFKRLNFRLALSELALNESNKEGTKYDFDSGSLVEQPDLVRNPGVFYV